MSHTPGPWSIAWEDDDGEPFDNGVRIDSPEGPVAFNVIDCSAILIAAAPEMLEAIRWIASQGYTTQSADIIDHARRALATAEGGTE